MNSTEISTFLEKHNLTQEDWGKANIEWKELKEIEASFESRLGEFEQAALSIVAVLQRNKSVHSVRWRIKDKEHLLAKIIRKLSDSEEKYQNIDSSNYDEIVTDLVGVRVLHLFKEEWREIQQFIGASWEVFEEPVAYYREGDKLEQFSGCKTQKHKAGYRSIHSIISTRPQKKDIKAEVQVRTVFEEGWSEIDHQVRYPKYSNNENIAYFLHIFNGLAGFADEMGTFVKRLAKEISDTEKLAEVHDQLCIELDNAEDEKKRQMRQLEELAKENTKIKEALNKFKDADQRVESSARNIKLKRELSNDYMSRTIAALENPSALDNIRRAMAALENPNALDNISRTMAALDNPTILDNISRRVAATDSSTVLDNISRTVAALENPTALDNLRRTVAALENPTALDNLRRTVGGLEYPPADSSDEESKKNGRKGVKKDKKQD